MNDILELSEISVADLLKSIPMAVRFFVDQQTACVGCSLARFCTLKDVISTYGLDGGEFFRELAKLNVRKL